ncbi:hypothetical protein CCACVL1_17304, partial [Corchorus capsularis]
MEGSPVEGEKKLQNLDSTSGSLVWGDAK